MVLENLILFSVQLWFSPEKFKSSNKTNKKSWNCSGFAIFGRFHEKKSTNSKQTNKNRENVVVLQFLAVFNFHFMRKIQKIDLIFSLLKSGIRGGEFILFQTKFCDLQTFRRIDESPFMCLKVKMVPLKVNPKWRKSWFKGQNCKC